MTVELFTAEFHGVGEDVFSNLGGSVGAVTARVGQGDPKKFVDVVGIYEMAPGQTRTVSIDGGNLFVERKGKREQLLPEVSEIFFRKGMEGRILFRHAENGKVDALIDRRNNEDLVWRKTSN